MTMADHDTFSDEFADRQQDWGATGSADWQVVNGQRGGILWGDNSGTNSTDSIAFNGRAWGDYRYTIELYRIGDVSADPAIGVAWRHDLDLGYYSLSLRDGAYAFGIPDLLGGSAVGGYTNLSWLDVDKWNEVIVFTDGDSHSFILNGHHIATMTDNTTAQGAIGVTLSPGAQAVYDNAYVTTLVDRVDTLPPMVTITSPTEDAVLGAALVNPLDNTVTVTISAADTAEGGNESGLDTIRVYLDGKGAGTVAGTPATSYVLSVDVSRASLGRHHISVYVEDKAHHRAFAGVDIFVVNQCASLGPGAPTCVP